LIEEAKTSLSAAAAAAHRGLHGTHADMMLPDTEKF
jgi:hypothetical protein